MWGDLRYWKKELPRSLKLRPEAIKLSPPSRLAAVSRQTAKRTERRGEEREGGYAEIEPC